MSKTTKQLIAKELRYKTSEISVRKGRGTAYNWLYITTPTTIEPAEKRRIEEILVDQNLVGTYCTDYGYNDVDRPNVRWDVKRPIK